MVTLLYALVGTICIGVLFLVTLVDVGELQDWADAAWFRVRWAADREPEAWRHLEAPPEPFGGRVYAAALAIIVALFLGALALPR
jgi:hypothetical protein